jgi:nucleoside phosphorylase
MPERNTGIGDGKEAASRKISTEDPTCRSIELTCHDYTVGWICALPKEQTAATAMLDQIHSDIPKPPNDPNTYTLGCIGRHNIVITCLPKGKIGNNSAATSAAQMARTFPSIKVGLMVGIGGGIPPRVRLGDVVISVPVAEFPGVVQWDIGKVEEDGFKRIGALNNPPTALLTALTKLETKHEMHGSRIRQYLDDLASKYPSLVSKYTWSDSLQDPLSTPGVSDHSRSGWQVILFSLWSLVLALYRYLSGSGLLAVDSRAESAVPTVYHDVHNTRRRSADVRVHYGLIASGNKVIKNAVDRDRLNESLGGNVLCVEMEAAGLMNNFPCIVIRGICDYADAQKNKDWQEYAAAIAAACAKELLEHVQPNDVDGERPLKDILGDG